MKRGCRSDDERPRAGDDPLSGIRARLFDGDGQDREIELKAGMHAEVGDRQLLWVDLDRRDEDAIRQLAADLALSDEDIERIAEEQGRARLTRNAERLHLTLEALEPDDDDRLVRRELVLLVGPNLLVTIHDGDSPAIDRFIDGLDGDTRLGILDAADLMSSLVDEVIAGYFALADLIDRDIDRLDERALRREPGQDVLAEIVQVRRRISLVRKTLAPHREALAALGRPEMKVEETIGQPWPGLGDRLERAIEAIEGLRGSLLGTYDIHMGRSAQRANDVMKVLTLLSAVLLPSVVLAGIMGMNFKLPFFDDPGNFYLALGGMVVLSLVILAIARWRRWL
ncbi:MAG TPA: magnesium transporter CorA family protein [Candidatus Saccharimonadales bacterium]|nr:magnesium transporter CorA family protein [Candidatus Saccharimonadales bacterium]